mmetsp:Transcript_115692/g.172896  ORF Transcript_115692/g.172896 Transcript_115692/m.172896 type:complete len:777 (-) Transcript_115692:192-2522(-)
MVFHSGSNSGSCEWVAFEQEQSSGGNGFEAIVRPTKEAPRIKRGESARRRNNDSVSVSSWMKQPINSDASWAPIEPPSTHQTATDQPKPTNNRPPRVRTSTMALEQAGTHRRKKSVHNPVSSDSSAASSSDRKSRGRSVERNATNALPVNAKNPSELSKSRSKDSRGRSRTRHSTEVVETPSVRGSSRDAASRDAAPSRGTSREARSSRRHSRGRSSSRSRTGTSTKERDRSTSMTRRSTSTLNGDNRSRASSRPPPTSSNRRSRSSSRTTVTRPRSTSRTRSSRPPPSTSRTRREMRTVAVSTSSVGGSVSRRQSASNRSVTSEEDHGSLRSLDANIGRDISFGRTKAGANLTPTSKKRSAMMEKLFGDQVTDEAKHSYLPRSEPSPTASVSSLVSWQQPEQIHSRILLTATVYHNTATNLWIATINTNQKGVAKNPATASKYLKAFSFSSEKEARESAIANAPPKMIPFEENPNCFICKGKFAMFRRAGHCRNCGVCICNACSVMWQAKMIPETYNLKKESQVKICKSCHFLSGSFKKALLDGDYEEAIALYGSGNINLRTPFPQTSKKKEEVMYPIHCGVEGGNIHVVRWLMEDHFCPIKVIRTGSGKKPKRGGSADLPILTSKSRSVLGIAMGCLHVDILRYLVVDCGVSIYESKDLKGSLRALEAVLLALPGSKGEFGGDSAVHRWDDASFDGESVTSSLGSGTLHDDNGTLGSKTSKRNAADSCIICYDHAIDCVMTPCGHQVCCLECSANLSACPVCNIRGEFIKIFRP